MEALNEKIKRFLNPGSGSGSGYGYGDGSGYGDGDGYGYGSGDGDGYGYGYGYGDGSGYGYGDGSGYGYGDGYGYGYGDGSGYGYGSGDGLISFNGQPVHYIDGIPTVIQNVHLNVAKGFTINSDLTTNPCFIVKDEEMHFAHGATLEEARRSLEAKIFEDMDEEERIEKFFEHFQADKTYKGTEFYEWHHILTGSCTFGRDSFVKNHGLDLEKEYTVEYFLKITSDSFGGETIKKLKKKYQSKG